MTAKPWGETVWELWSEAIKESACDPAHRSDVMIFAEKIRRAAFEEVENIDAYDAGLLGGHAGCSVEWWQDYLRAELARSDDHWRTAIRAKMEGEMNLKRNYALNTFDGVLDALKPKDETAFATAIPAMVEEHKLRARLGCCCDTPYPHGDSDNCPSMNARALLASAGIEWRETK